jgi:hypothetical protein
MSDSQDPKIDKPASGVPSPPLPKIPSPAIPDVKNPPAKSQVTDKNPVPAASFHLADPEAEAKRKADAQKAAAQDVPKKETEALSQTQPTPKPVTPKPFSRAAVPGPKSAPNLTPHTTGSKTPATPHTPELHQSLEHRPLSIEEKEKLDGTSPLKGWKKFLEFLQPVALWLVRVSVLFAAGSAAFILLNLLHGNLAPTSPLANSEALLHPLRLASLTLEISLIALACCLMLLWFGTAAVAFSVLAVGLFLHFGSPLLLFNQVGRSTATAIIALPLRQAGIVLIALGLFKYVIDVAFWIRALPERMQARADIGVAEKAEPAQRRIAKNSNAFSPCWQLPFCREVIRKQCPAYLARTTCWKFGRGCYCDEEMISRIIRGESLNVIKAPTRMSRKGKPPCGRCYIYLEHQAHKFRLYSPLAVPATVLIVYFLWPIYTNVFNGFSHYLDRFWDLLSFNPHTLATGVLKASPEDYSHLSTLSPDQITHVALTIFGVLLGFMLLIYISKFIEWAIYTAKW